MRKLLAFALAGTMAFGLTACGGSATTATTAATTAAATEAATTVAAAETTAAEITEAATEAAKTNDIFASVFWYTNSDTYLSSVRTALDAALKEAGIEFQNYDSNSNQTTQNEQIDTAIAQGSNLLIVNVVTAGSIDVTQTILDKAAPYDIPVIFFNRAIEPEGEEGKILNANPNIAYVGTEAVEAGHLQGQMIGEYLVANYDDIDLNKDGKISYAMFMGQLGNAEAIFRTQYGVEDANIALEAAGKPALEYFDASNTDKYQVDQDGNWSATAANNYMVTNLAQYNEDNGNMIELVICNNDGMAEGAIAALNDKGYNLGTDDCVTIPVFGVDATDAAKQLINDGKMTGTVKQDAEGMANGIAYLAKNIAAGKDIMADTEQFNVPAETPNKLFIPYAPYSAE